MLTANEKDPVKFAEASELFMKGFLVISMGISISGTYAAQAAAEYGFSAIESMVALWILFLLFQPLSFVCCTLKHKTADGELWQEQGLFRVMPITGVAFFFAVCVIAGLPRLSAFLQSSFFTGLQVTLPLTIFL